MDDTLIFSAMEMYGSKRVVTKRAVIILHRGSLRVGYYVPESLKMVEIGGEGRIEVAGAGVVSMERNFSDS